MGCLLSPLLSAWHGKLNHMMPSSTVARLRSELAEIQESLAGLIGSCSLRTRSYKVVLVPEFYFESSNNAQIKRQMNISERYLTWYELFRLLFKSLPSGLASEVDSAHKNILEWIELDSTWALVADNEANVASCRKDFQILQRLLDVQDGSGENVVVPDTNALIHVPDPRRYKDIAGSSAFSFVLLPEVLRELDDLKNFSRKLEFQNKVRKVVGRIAGWRRQGSLIQGVTLDKTITVRALAKEPRMDQSLSWLDQSCNDDRIIASVLELQASEPHATLWLVTSDINLQNKCDLAHIPCAETPR